MRSRPFAPLLAFVAAMTVQAALADTALLLVNDRYDNGQNLRQGSAIAALQAPLQAAGFDVIVANDATGAQLRQALNQLLQSGEEERIFIAAMGHVVRSLTDDWLVGRDADRPNLATIGGDGLSIAALLEVAAGAPGRSVVLLGLERRGMDVGTGLNLGLGLLEPPQGVTLLTGAPEDLADFATDHLLVPGTDLARALSEVPRLRAYGFISSAVPYIATAPAAPGPVQPLPPVPTQASAEETALWNAATELDTAGAYRAYLARYPAGFYAAQARTLAIALESDPLTLARAAEDALNLTRDQRQQIQRSLSILDYETRGIDGIFGTGTRTAIQGWQTARGYPVTGYLDAPQVNALGQQSAERAAELEAAALAAREEEARADTAYWQITGQGATEAGLRLYLDRYPDGLNAEVAEARLAEYERAARSEAEARDRAAWDLARATDTEAAYRRYLTDFPDGAFTDQATARIDQLTGAGNGLTSQQIALYEAREAALNLPPITRSLMEQRLDALDLEPGVVDGRFDDRTRRALRRYQRARGLDVTGYLDQTTVVRLLAEAVGGIIRLDGVINR